MKIYSSFKHWTVLLLEVSLILHFPLNSAQLYPNSTTSRSRPTLSSSHSSSFVASISGSNSQRSRLGASPTPTACAGCAYSFLEEILSFPGTVDVAEITITATIVPHVTVYADGSRQTVNSTFTSWLANATMNDVFVQPISTDVTWEMFGQTLTYPLTYEAIFGVSIQVSSAYSSNLPVPAGPIFEDSPQVASTDSFSIPVLAPQCMVSAETATLPDQSVIIYNIVEATSMRASAEMAASSAIASLTAVSSFLHGSTFTSCTAFANPIDSSGPGAGTVNGGGGIVVGGAPAAPAGGNSPVGAPDDGGEGPGHLDRSTVIPIPHTSVAVLTVVADPVVVTSQGALPLPTDAGQTIAGKAVDAVTATTSENVFVKGVLSAIGLTDNVQQTSETPNGLVAAVLTGLGLPLPLPQPTDASGEGGQGVGNEAHAVVVGGQTVVPAASGGGVVVAGQTIAPGSAVILGDGTPISVAPGGVVVVAGQSATIPAAIPGITGAAGNPPSPVILGGQTLTPAPNGGVIVNGQTVAPGAAVTLANGTPLSVAPGGGVVIVAGQTATLQNFGSGSAFANAGSPITLNGATLTPIAGGAIIVGTQTVMPGNIVTLTDGKTLSLAPGGTAVVIGGQSATIPSVPIQTDSPSRVYIVNGERITLAPSGGVIFAEGHTVSPGSAITLSDGKVLSVGTGGTLVVDGSTTTLPTTTGTGSSPLTSSFTSMRVGGTIAPGVGSKKNGAAGILSRGSVLSRAAGMLAGVALFYVVGIL